MIIVGAGSLAKEMVSFINFESSENSIVFFLEPKFKADNVFLNKYKLINDYQEIEKYIKNVDNEFIVAIQHNRTRERIVNRFEQLNGNYISLISKNSFISNLNVKYQQAFIQPFTLVAHNVTLGKGCILEPWAKIGHDIIIGDYVFIAPDVSIAGPCKIGKYSNIGLGSLILPGIEIGKNAFIGAGSVVFRDVKDNEVFVNNRNL